MIDVDNIDPTTDRARYVLALANALEGNEENTVGSTDTALICEALRAQSMLIDAGLA
ncbi:hypothetical protein [Pseudorhodoplanes sinuspersici]|uniref:hypothetical protein n=1 Tax=Pseudorhodoplanes sinuspersici TaxID=1235591 RepID=UPI000FF4A409|nr:hypothetical protein [Pseudorhodoplanes sinuspersici]RKE70647.1 hypothetical protein DFP91_2888 [Pseudorhodoplanes sinuspersici]